MRPLRQHRPRTRRDRAVVLILVLWILVILALIAYSLLFQVTTEVSVTSIRKKQLKARALARAGVAKAIIDLRNDALFDTADEAKNFDAEGDVWARKEEGKEDATLSRDEEDGYFNARVYDEEGLFNLNAMNRGSRDMLEKIIEKIGYSEDDAKVAAAAIIDWHDVDDNPALDSAPSDSEGKAYAIIRGEDEGGETDPDKIDRIIFRNEDYMTVDELLEVYGITPQLYFGPDSPEAEFYEKILPQRNGDRFEMERRTHSRLDDSPPVGLRDYFTVYGSRTLNINTAPAHVLAVFADVTGLDDGDRFAETVIRKRRGGKDEDIDNSDAFKERNDIFANSEIQGIMGAGGINYPVGVNSTCFRIISEGTVGEVRVRIEAVAYRQMLKLQRDEDFEYIDRAKERRDQNSGRYDRRKNDSDERVVDYPFVRIIQEHQI